MTNQKTPEPTEPTTPPSFDITLTKEYHELVTDTLKRYPQLRSVVVVFDYHDGHNEADAKKGIWRSNEQSEEFWSYASIVGSTRQTIAMLEMQFRALYALRAQVDHELYDKAKELHNLEIEIAEKQKQAEAAAQAADGPPVRHADRAEKTKLDTEAEVQTRTDNRGRLQPGGGEHD